MSMVSVYATDTILLAPPSQCIVHYIPHPDILLKMQHSWYYAGCVVLLPWETQIFHDKGCLLRTGSTLACCTLPRCHFHVAIMIVNHKLLATFKVLEKNLYWNAIDVCIQILSCDLSPSFQYEVVLLCCFISQHIDSYSHQCCGWIEHNIWTMLVSTNCRQSLPLLLSVKHQLSMYFALLSTVYYCKQWNRLWIPYSV